MIKIRKITPYLSRIKEDCGSISDEELQALIHKSKTVRILMAESDTVTPHQYRMFERVLTTFYTMDFPPSSGKGQLMIEKFHEMASRFKSTEIETKSTKYDPIAEFFRIR